MAERVWTTTEEVAGEFQIAHSDHLLLQNFEKHNNIRESIIGDTSQFWDDVEPNKIESFLSAYFNTNIKLLAIEKDTNVAYGNPVWAFAYQKSDAPKKEPTI